MNSRSLLRSALLLICLPVATGFTTSASSETEIAVGVYHFPPVATVQGDNEAAGLLGDVLEELEAVDQALTFRIVHTSPKRRHLDFEEGLYDVIFFESLDWGWKSQPVEATRPVLADQEVYIALNKPGRDQSFFDNVAERNIAIIAGYHYGFAGSSTDDGELENRFSIEFSDSHERNLNLIRADRPSVAEVAVISHSYLQRHLEQHPEDRDHFLISEAVDQEYLLRIVAREDGPVDVETLQRLLSRMIDDGRYQRMVKRHGLQLPPDLAAK